MLRCLLGLCWPSLELFEKRKKTQLPSTRVDGFTTDKKIVLRRCFCLYRYSWLEQFWKGARHGRSRELPKKLQEHKCHSGQTLSESIGHQGQYMHSLSEVTGYICIGGGRRGHPMHFLPRKEVSGQVSSVSVSLSLGRKFSVNHEGKELGFCPCFLLLHSPHLGLLRHPHPRLRLHCGCPVRDVYWRHFEVFYLTTLYRTGTSLVSELTEVYLKVPFSLSDHNT